MEEQRRFCVLNKICIAFDGSENAYRAFDFALELPKLCSGANPEISVVSVVVPPEIANVEADVDVTAFLTQQLEETLKGLKERAKDRDITINITVGHAAEQILKYVSDNNCDMLVMGQVGISAIEAFLLGSVASGVATNAPCTVTLVK